MRQYCCLFVYINIELFKNHLAINIIYNEQRRILLQTIVDPHPFPESRARDLKAYYIQTNYIIYVSIRFSPPPAFDQRGESREIQIRETAEARPGSLARSLADFRIKTADARSALFSSSSSRLDSTVAFFRGTSSRHHHQLYLSPRGR